MPTDDEMHPEMRRVIDVMVDLNTQITTPHAWTAISRRVIDPGVLKQAALARAIKLLEKAPPTTTLEEQSHRTQIIANLSSCYAEGFIVGALYQKSAP